MPDNIVFNQIPVDIRTPGVYIEIDNSQALKGLPGMPRKLLVLTQRLATGTVAAGVPTRITGKGQGEVYFGRGSLGHLMCDALMNALRVANATADVYAVALDDLAAGVAASGSITVAGSPSASGVIALYIGGVRVQVGVTAGQATAAVATAIAAAITARSDLPVTASVDGTITSKVNLTARNKGETGNDIDIRHSYHEGEALPAGIALTIAAMTGGAGNPDVATAIAAAGDEPYTSIVCPWTDAATLTALVAEMDTRWGAMEQRTGHVFMGLNNTFAGLTTWGSARNSVHLTAMGAKGSPTPAWIWGAVLGGIVEAAGAIDPARPFQTLTLPGILPPAVQDRFTRPERDLLLRDGISTWTVDQGGNVLIERVITTYQTSATGIEDVSYLDLNTKWTVDYIRYAVRARISLKFPRHKLADDGTRFAAGQPIVTPSILRAELLALFRDLEEAGLVEGFDQFKRDLNVVRSTADVNRVNAVIPPDIINQFRVFAAAVQFIL